MKFIAWLVAAATLLSFGGCGTSTPAAPVETPPSEPPLPTVADIKIMSWNILNPAWGGIPADMRIDGVVQTLEREAPDVIGFQEVGEKWHAEWDAMPDRYAVVDPMLDDDTPYMTRLMYNTETLTLGDHGVRGLDVGSDIRVVAWAVFTVSGTDVSFLVTNTHPHSKEYECLVHTATYLDIIKDLRATYSLPLLSVGDFNAVESSRAYQMHLNDGFTDAKYADGVELITDKDSYLNGDFGGKVSSGLGSRDHIFFKGNVTPLTFATLYENGEDELSDHLPVTAVVTIRQ